LTHQLQSRKSIDTFKNGSIVAIQKVIWFSECHQSNSDGIDQLSEVGLRGSSADEGAASMDLARQGLLPDMLALTVYIQFKTCSCSYDSWDADSVSSEVYQRPTSKSIIKHESKSNYEVNDCPVGV
jgi:hypothetical protein